MSEKCNDDCEKSKDIFNVLTFERKLVELVEELRLRRNLENESEKTLKSIMEEKYKEELNWEEIQRRYIREKDDLEQQIDLLKRKLEDKVCVSDDDKAKQQVINKTYSYEIRALKEELRVSKSEKMNLQKRIQELEAKLNLHNKFQENIVRQISDIRKNMKSVMENSQELATVQKNVMNNVAEAKMTFKKYDLCNQHLQQSLTIIGKKSEALKKELITSRSELIILRNSMPVDTETPDRDLEIGKLEKKILELENLLSLSRKENQKTLNNFLESNQLLCKFMDKYHTTHEQEKCTVKELEKCQDKLKETERRLEKALEEIRKIEESIALKEKQRIENQSSREAQTEENLLKSYCAAREIDELNGFKGTSQDLTDELRNYFAKLQRNATIQQSQICVENMSLSTSSDAKTRLYGFSDDKIAEKKITFSEVLKRKIEVMETGDKIEFISMKRRLSENGAYPLVVEVPKSGFNDSKTLTPHLDQACHLALDQPAAEKVVNGHPLGMPLDHKYFSSQITPEEIKQRKEENQFCGKETNPYMI